MHFIDEVLRHIALQNFADFIRILLVSSLGQLLVTGVATSKDDLSLILNDYRLSAILGSALIPLQVLADL